MIKDMTVSKGSCLKEFGLSHENPSLFVNAQCFKPVVYLIWSGFWMLFFFSMLMLDIYYEKHAGPEYLEFLTNLTYIFQNSTLILDFTVSLYVYINRKDIRDGKATEMEWYLKLQWLMFNVTNTASLMVSIGYYAALKPKFTHGSINTHLLNSVHTLLNIFFCAKPVRILHFYQPMIYGLAYLLFSVIYHLAGADPVYEPLDWDDPLRTGIITSLAVFIGIPFIHTVVFSLYKMRVCCSNNCCTCNKTKVAPEGGRDHHIQGGQPTW